MTVRIPDLAAHTVNWLRTWRLIRAAAPRWTLVWASLLVVQGLLPAISVYLTKLVVDSLVAAIAAGGVWESVRPTLVLVALAAGVMLLSEFLQSAVEWVRTAQAELVQDHVKRLLHQRSAAVDLAFYESPDYHDRLDQARGETSARPQALLENFGSLIQNGITLFAMAAIIIRYAPWLPLLLLLSTVPAVCVVLSFDRRYHEWWQRTTADRRRTQYYDLVLTQDWSAAELRLFGLGDHFRSAYQTLRQRLRVERLEQMRQQSLAKLGAGALALLVLGLALAWMVFRALQGAATLGDLALFYQAFQRGQGLVRSLLGSLSQIYSNTLFLGNLFTFLDLEPRVTDPPRPAPAPARLQQGIRFEHVTFRYPGSEWPALQDFNLVLPRSKIVAIVGANGAGKTTLVKLLCRFYDPEAGRVELDGIDIRNLRAEDLRRLITVLFQFPLAYQATAGENIALGDLEAAPDLAEIEAAARRAGAHEVIARLPRGYDTHLGKWFENGVELSGGEWQRIATARAFLRRAQVIVLDEPTSLMDSWTEMEWFERLRALARDRIALIITHRFTIAMRADVIHVMDGGRIVESGSHQELLARNGLYAQSWTAQMRAASGVAEPALLVGSNGYTLGQSPREFESIPRSAAGEPTSP